MRSTTQLTVHLPLLLRQMLATALAALHLISLQGCIFFDGDGGAATGERCREDSACQGVNVACVERRCVDLLSDAAHCGAVGQGCAAGSQCASGLCTCGSRNAGQEANERHTLITAHPFERWPEAQLGTYPQALNRDAQGYALSAPHFVTAFAATPDTIRLQTLDGAGILNPQTAEIVGDANLGEGVVLATALLSLERTQQLKLFVVWEGTIGRTRSRRLYSYAVRADAQAASKLRIERDADNAQQPIEWAANPQLLDFGVASASHQWSGGEGDMIALSVAISPPVLSGQASRLNAALYMQTSERLEIASVAPEVSIGTIYQFARGIPTALQLTRDAQGNTAQVEVQITDLDDRRDADFQAPSTPLGQTRGYYNARSLSAAVNPSTGRIEPLALADVFYTVGTTTASLADTTSILSGNRLFAPLSAVVRHDVMGGAEYITWQREGSGSGVSTSTQLRRLSGGMLSEAIELGRLQTEQQVYDSARIRGAAGGSEALLWISYAASSSNVTQLMMRSLNTAAGTPSVGVSRAFGDMSRATRLAVASSPHATGVLVSGMDHVRLYLIAGGEPVCK